MILIGMGEPGNDPAAIQHEGATRQRRRTTAGRRLDEAAHPQQAGGTQNNDDGDGGGGGGGGGAGGVGGPPAPLTHRQCVGTGSVCLKTDSCKDQNVPLGRLCLCCSRAALIQTVAVARVCLWGGGAGPAWWSDAVACSVKPSPPIKEVRLYYTLIVLAAFDKRQKIQLTM